MMPNIEAPCCADLSRARISSRTYAVQPESSILHLYALVHEWSTVCGNRYFGQTASLGPSTFTRGVVCSD